MPGKWHYGRNYSFRDFMGVSNDFTRNEILNISFIWYNNTIYHIWWASCVISFGTRQSLPKPIDHWPISFIFYDNCSFILYYCCPFELVANDLLLFSPRLNHSNPQVSRCPKSQAMVCRAGINAKSDNAQLGFSLKNHAALILRRLLLLLLHLS